MINEEIPDDIHTEFIKLKTEVYKIVQSVDPKIATTCFSEYVIKSFIINKTPKTIAMKLLSNMWDEIKIANE